MIRTRRFLSFMLAIALAVTSVVPVSAEEIPTGNQTESVVIEDVSQNETETFADVSEDTAIITVSGNEETASISQNEEEENGTIYTLTVNEDDYVYQFGGLESLDMTEYPEILEEEFGTENKFGSLEAPVEDVDGAVSAVTEAIENRENPINLSEYNIYYDGSEEAQTHLVGIFANSVNYHPDFFYYTGIESFSVNEEGMVEEVEVGYEDLKASTDYETALQAAYDEAVTDKSAPDYVKAMQLHDWLVQHVVYGYGSNQYSAYGAIVDRQCVCMGYALAYGDLLAKAGIGHGYVTSTSLNHMWNVVQISGKWYHVDCTWDDPTGRYLGTDRYWFFLKSDSIMRNYPQDGTGTHKASDWKYSIGTYAYYGNASINCSSTTYDHYWWNEAVSAIIYQSGYFYYVATDSSSCYKNYLVKRNASSGDETTVEDFSSMRWTDQSYSSGPIRTVDIYGNNSSNCWTCLSSVDGYIFYNTKNNVYRYDPSLEKTTEIYESSSLVWTSLACGSTLYVRIGDSYSTSSQKTSYLFPINNFTISSTYTSTAYGSTTKATITTTCTQSASGTATWSCKQYNATTGAYDQDPTGTITTSKSGNTLTCKYVFDPTGLDAGSYSFRFFVTLNDDTFAKTITIKITKVAFSATNASYPLSNTYDGEKISTPYYSNFTTNAPSLTFAWYTDSKLTKTLGVEPYKAGTYYLKVSYAGGTNVKAGSKTFTVTIAKKKITAVIADQDLLYGEAPSQEVGSDIIFTGLVEGDTVDSVTLKPSTTELTTKGTITCSAVTILHDGDNVTASYTITYTKGKLTVSKVPLTITAHDQTITYGQDISREMDDTTITGEDFDAAQFVVTGVTVTPSSLNVGEARLNAGGAKIYRIGTTSDVTKYFNITYVSGNLTVNKAETETTSYTKKIRTDYRDDYTVQYSAAELVKIPADAQNVTYVMTRDQALSALTVSLDESIGLLDLAYTGSEDTGRIGTREKIVLTVSSDNYKDLTCEIYFEVEQKATLILHGNGGTFDGEDPVSVSAFLGDSLTTVAEPKLAYQAFTGWVNADGDAVTVVTAENADYYAQWAVKYTTAAVTANLSDGEEVTAGTRLYLTCPTNGAKIYYALDGAEPDVTDNDLYTDGITITEDTTIKAFAAKEHYQDSEELTLSVAVKEEEWEYPEDEDSYEANALWVTGIEDKEYTGSPLTQDDIHVYYDRKLLTAGTDYTVTYKDNTKVTTAAKPAKLIITGKGNYSGSVTKTFAITNANGYVSLAGATVTGIAKSYGYTGNAITPVPTVKVGGVTLTANTDYTYKIENNINTGTATLTIVGSKNSLQDTKYTGTKTVTFKIVGTRDISKAKITYTDADYTNPIAYACTGSAVTPAFTLKLGTTTLTSDDYTVTYAGNILPGNISIKVTGKNAYKGTKTFKVALKAVSITGATITGLTGSATYLGSPITQPDAVVTLNGSALTLGTDYTVSYKNNNKKGTATVLFIGCGKYAGTVKKTYKILGYNLLTSTGHSFTVSYPKTVTYEKGGCKPGVVLTLDGNILKAGTDYTVSYANNNVVGNRTKLPTITIKGKGSFSGTITRRFSITSASLEAAGVSFTLKDKTYSSKAGNYKQTLKIYDANGKALSSSDYTGVTYTYAEDMVYTDRKGQTISLCTGDVIGARDIVPAGAVISVTVTGKGNYSGTITATCRMIAGDISSAKISVKSQTYSGQQIIPSASDITVKCGSTRLTTQDFIVAGYETNTNKGYGYVIIKGIGNYSGSKKVKFTITARKISK